MNISTPVQNLIDTAGYVGFRARDQTIHPCERIAGRPLPKLFQLLFQCLAYELRQLGG